MLFVRDSSLEDIIALVSVDLQVSKYIDVVENVVTQWFIVHQTWDLKVKSSEFRPVHSCCVLSQDTLLSLPQTLHIGV